MVRRQPNRLGSIAVRRTNPLSSSCDITISPDESPTAAPRSPATEQHRSRYFAGTVRGNRHCKHERTSQSPRRWLLDRPTLNSKLHQPPVRSSRYRPSCCRGCSQGGRNKATPVRRALLARPALSPGWRKLCSPAPPRDPRTPSPGRREPPTSVDALCCPAAGAYGNGAGVGASARGPPVGTCCRRSNGNSSSTAAWRCRTGSLPTPSRFIHTFAPAEKAWLNTLV